MSSLFKNYKMDHEKEVNGVLIKREPNEDGTVPTFRIARMSKSNVRYTKALEEETRDYRRQIEAERLDNMIAEQITRKVFVRSVLLGWDNIQDEDGKLIAFNEANALALFEALPDLYEELKAEANRVVLFRSQQQEDEAKN